ncbi:SHOCT domain-containing protein [Lentzea waywayandensis]|nr:SHOCT domain-containing protein [Lentzea waywayandensis]
MDSPRGRAGGKNLDTTTEEMAMTWYYGTPMGWGGFSMMALTMLVFWGGLVALVVVMLRRSPHTGSETRILRERLARGEIDTEEFERVRKTLDSR